MSYGNTLLNLNISKTIISKFKFVIICLTLLSFHLTPTWPKLLCLNSYVAFWSFVILPPSYRLEFMMCKVALMIIL
jgi:hypothetical protein